MTALLREAPCRPIVNGLQFTTDAGWSYGRRETLGCVQSESGGSLSVAPGPSTEMPTSQQCSSRMPVEAPVKLLAAVLVASPHHRLLF